MAHQLEPVGRFSEILQSSSSVAVFFANGIGDAIFTLPTLRALASGFAGRITMLIEDGHHRFLYDELKLKHLALSPTSSDPESRRNFDVECFLPYSLEADLFIALVPWKSNCIDDLVRRIQPCATIGFFSKYNIRVPYDPTKNNFDMHFAIARCIFPQKRLEEYSHPPLFNPGVCYWGDKILGGIEKPLRRVVLHTESFSSGKSLPPYTTAELVKEIVTSDENIVVIYIGVISAARDLEMISPQVIVMTDIPLALAMYLASQADYFIGVDSCMLHVADLARVPGVGIFGPSKPEEFGFRFSPKHVHLSVQGPVDSVSVHDIVSAFRQIYED